jgi:hypothetical protein
VGWGEQDGPYMERLPTLIAQAAIQAVNNLTEASFASATPPAEHIAFSREAEGRPAYEDALKEDWQPKHPELTDRNAHVIRVQGRDGLLGFLSSYSCHPVVCCEQTHSLHGDFVGVATNLVESEFPGCVGIFLQGSHGDINTAVCHEPQDRSMHALNVFAARYARVIRAGLQTASPMPAAPVASASEGVGFQRAEWTEQRLRTEMQVRRNKVLNDPAADAGSECRLHTVFLNGMRKVLADLKERGTHRVPLEMQAIRAGDLRIVSTPFELFRDIKNRLVRESGREALLVLSTTNDCAGYAVSKGLFEKASYAAEMVPFILGVCPLTPAIEDEIVAAGLRLLDRLQPAGESGAGRLITD